MAATSGGIDWAGITLLLSVTGLGVKGILSIANLQMRVKALEDGKKASDEAADARFGAIEGMGAERGKRIEALEDWKLRLDAIEEYREKHKGGPR